MSDLSQYTKFTEAEIGITLARPVLITAMEENVAKNGKPFVKFTMKDGNSEINAIMFETTKDILKEQSIDVETVADVELKVSSYDNSKSFMVSEIKPTADSTLSSGDFTKLPPIDRDIMYNEIISLLKSVADNKSGNYQPLSDLAVSIIEDNKQGFMSSSAAVKMHHNLLGGLIYHTYRMVKTADALCSVYTNLDRELLLCGTALHDIGKLWEYKTSATGDAEMTSSGVLFGHLYMGASLIKHYSEKGNYNPEKVKLLVHLILSHHGKQEYGAVTLPAIPEALVLSHVDDLDAKMYVFDETYNELNPGEVTEKKNFMLGTKLYKSYSE